MCGSLLTTYFREQFSHASSIVPLRGTRFELVDSSGRTRWVLETTKYDGVRMRFVDTKQAIPLELSVAEDGDPYIGVNGRDGQMRASLALTGGGSDKPLLAMSDGKPGTKLQVGAAVSDYEDSSIDVWGLFFGNPVERKPLAGIGMDTSPGRLQRGLLSVRGADGQHWLAPVKTAVD